MKKFLIIVFSTLTSVFGAAKYTGLMYETNTGLVFPGNLSYAVTNVSGGQANHLTNNIRFYGALNPVSIEELFKGTVSVLAFGATTNKADNTTNIQAALDFGGNYSRVLLPYGGTYNISDTLKIHAGQTLEGLIPARTSQAGVTKIVMTGTSTNDMIKPYDYLTAESHSIHIRNIGFEGSANTKIGINFIRITRSSVENCYVINCDYGIVGDANVINQSYFCKYESTESSNNRKVGWLFRNGANENRFFDCMAIGSPTGLVFTANSSINKLYGFSFQGVSSPPTDTCILNDAPANFVFGAQLEGSPSANGIVTTANGSWGAILGVTFANITNRWVDNPIRSGGFHAFNVPIPGDNGFEAGIGTLLITNNPNSLLNTYWFSLNPQSTTNVNQLLWNFPTTGTNIFGIYNGGTDLKWKINANTGSQSLNTFGSYIDFYDTRLGHKNTGELRITDGSTNNLYRDLYLRNLYSATTSVTDDSYSSGWDGSTNVPTKNAVYDKIESIVAGGSTNSTILVNGASVIGPNFTNSATVTFSVANATNISATASGGGGGIANTMINSGTSVANQLPRYSDTTGTNLSPTSVTVSSGTNLASGTLNITNSATFQGAIIISGMPTFTIASDAIDVTGYSKALIETEGGAASDSLQTINGGVAGKLFYFLNTLNARNITWKHIIGNIICGTGADFTTGSGDLVVGIYIEGHNKWYVWPAGKDIDSIRNGELDVASATTTDVATALSRNIRITGTTTITGLGTVQAGVVRFVRMAGALTLTHNATSLILPNNGNNITTAAGDSFMAESLGSGNWKVYIYQKADGTILGVNGIINGGTGQTTASKAFDALSQTGELNIASATTTDLSTLDSQKVQITGTTTITAFGTSPAGTMKWIRFGGALTLTYNATSLILPNAGSNIATAAGDTCLAVSLGSGNWRVYTYQKVNGQALVDNTGGAGSVYVNAVSVSNPNFIGSQFTATTTTNISLSNTLTITNSGQVFNTVYLGTATNVTIDPFLGSYSWAPSDNCRWQFATNTLSDTNKEYNIRLFLQAPSAGKVVTNVVDTYTVEGRWDALVAGLNTFNISYKAGTVRISHEQAFLDASQVILANGSTNVDTAFGSMQTQLNTKGDFSSNTGTSVDSEVVVFSGTAGKTGKRATGTGVAHLTSGVLSVGTTTISEGGSGQTTANAAEDAFQQVAEVSLASASTTDLGAQTSQKVLVTGTTTITSFGTVASGTVRDVRFNGALTLTHNATSLILPTGANITTVAGDILRAISEGSGNWRIRYYTRADGTSLQGYATIQEEGSGLTKRNTLNFIGGGVTAVDNSTKTDVTVTRTGVERSIWIPASAMVPSNTNFPSSATISLGTTTNYVTKDVFDFDDTVDEKVEFQVVFPHAWNASTIKYRVYFYSAAATTGAAEWELRAKSVADNESDDVAWGTGVLVTKTVSGTATRLNITSTSAALTVATTPAINEVVNFELYRRPTDTANDTLVGDARMSGLMLYYTETTTEPAAP